MTPAINELRRVGIAHSIHSYEHEPSAASYGGAAAQRLGLDPARVFKTLVVVTERGELLIAIVPVSGSLDLKALARAAGCRSCAMADSAAAQRATGYVIGGISPVGQKRRLRTFIDSSAQDRPSVFVSAGRRGLEIELTPNDLAASCSAMFAAIARAR